MLKTNAIYENIQISQKNKNDFWYQESALGVYQKPFLECPTNKPAILVSNHLLQLSLFCFWLDRLCIEIPLFAIANCSVIILRDSVVIFSVLRLFGRFDLIREKYFPCQQICVMPQHCCLRYIISIVTYQFGSLFQYIQRHMYTYICWLDHYKLLHFGMVSCHIHWHLWTSKRSCWKQIPFMQIFKFHEIPRMISDKKSLLFRLVLSLWKLFLECTTNKPGILFSQQLLRFALFCFWHYRLCIEIPLFAITNCSVIKSRWFHCNILCSSLVDFPG